MKERSNNIPVLLLKGFTNGFTGTPGELLTQDFTTAVGRGTLKYLDVLFFDDDTLYIVNDYGNFTVSVGGQNVYESEGMQNYVLDAQFGKDNLWDLRTSASEDQTLNFVMDSRDSIYNKAWQLIAKYTTPAHELFLRKFKLKFNTGLKRKGYQIARVFNTTDPVILNEKIPTYNGGVIAVAISQNGNYQFADQLLTWVTLSINGVNIIEDMAMSYFNILNGRDAFLNPIELTPGSNFQLRLDPVELFPGSGILPAQETTWVNLTFYFGGNEITI